MQAVSKSPSSQPPLLPQGLPELCPTALGAGPERARSPNPPPLLTLLMGQLGPMQPFQTDSLIPRGCFLLPLVPLPAGWSAFEERWVGWFPPQAGSSWWAALHFSQ